MSEQTLLKKRLHISGLTPSITPADLERRLSSFGKVMAMDGFGARDALGDPRKFGFVTMEIGTKELAKCLNVLSGSTWKGVRLRIGEAKPDFRERLAKTNSQPPRPVRPKRTRIRDYGYPSSTLPLTPLSTAAAVSTPGWIKTPSGRVVRPMRMRPERPLEPMRNTSETKGTNGKVKKRRPKQPLARARQRLIDPTKWDSVYLRGIFLDSVPVPLPASRDTPESPNTKNGGTLDEGDVEEEAFSRQGGTDGEAHDHDVDMEEIHPSISIEMSPETPELAPQKNLKALFAPREDASFSLLDHLDLDLELDTDILGLDISSGPSQGNGQLSEPVLAAAQSVQIPAAKSTTKARSRVTLDPSLPLLFPTVDSLPYPATSTTPIHPHGTPTCFLFPSATRVRDLNHLLPRTSFTRSSQDTSERIREMWEKDKSALTREWKKAWREARGRRRGKAGGEVGGGY